MGGGENLLGVPTLLSGLWLFHQIPAYLQCCMDQRKSSYVGVVSKSSVSALSLASFDTATLANFVEINKLRHSDELFFKPLDTIHHIPKSEQQLVFFCLFFLIDNHTEYYLQYHIYINNIKDTFYVHCVTALTILIV